ncbi:MAG TPA: bifunctional diaminohydroxyphosphoribosylaminopyrimidine deaminase/5-amino-6-(5-phosphoribosylamino)uracil reductase RibD [Mycobacteriales bacterium]|nr:bifunctional diaminohydroxyphosphoribosylaminopyrimidine deaminase/5-amino-6-(5-phosphoribosylamino)uracil reductase RibD [Mycobacteriales bacterium]
MDHALALSRKVLGRTSPNPPVGAVVLSAAGEIVGAGATQPPGGDHAEIVALREAGEQARGGTMVVTLEPCRHTGRTGPCTEALLAAGVRRVVFGCVDPTTSAGGGAQVLRAAGLEVATDPAVDVAKGPLEAWLTSHRTGRPFVTWKYAATLDGRSAAADGTSRWITSPAARADAHRLRAESDAVGVGIGTVLADDPELTVRPDPGHQPLRVVFDSEGRTPATARVRNAAGPTLLVTSGPRPADVDVIVTARHDLPGALQGLAERGVVSVLLEGGPHLAGSFITAGLVDRVVAYVAPALLGSGQPALAHAAVGTIAAATRLVLDEVVRVGNDVRLTARPTSQVQEA